MFSWRRIIACLLILVFAPASVLAATPFKMCFGSDGHRAIEAVVTAHHHSHPDFADANSGAVQKTDSTSAWNTYCYDVGMLDEAQRLTRSTAKPDKLKSFTGLLPFFLLILAPVADCDSTHPAPAQAGLIVRDPHLASLATIVLLI